MVKRLDPYPQNVLASIFGLLKCMTSESLQQGVLAMNSVVSPKKRKDVPVENRDCLHYSGNYFTCLVAEQTLGLKWKRAEAEADLVSLLPCRACVPATG